MATKRTFLLEVPGDPLSDYLKATLSLAPTPQSADAIALPVLPTAALCPLIHALLAKRPVYLPAEGVSELCGRDSLSALTKSGLVICPLTELPRWVQSGVSCPKLLTLERLKALAAQGFDRVYLSASPAATPLALRWAGERNIHLTGGTYHGAR